MLAIEIPIPRNLGLKCFLILSKIDDLTLYTLNLTLNLLSNLNFGFSFSCNDSLDPAN